MTAANGSVRLPRGGNTYSWERGIIEEGDWFELEADYMGKGGDGHRRRRRNMVEEDRNVRNWRKEKGRGS